MIFGVVKFDMEHTLCLVPVRKMGIKQLILTLDRDVIMIMFSH